MCRPLQPWAPVLFFPGRFRPSSGTVANDGDFLVTVNDIAPSLATLMDVETPSGSAGRVLTEIFQH